MSTRLGLRRGSSAALVIGIYGGFFLAMSASVMDPNLEGLKFAGKMWGGFIIASIIILSPILAMREKPHAEDNRLDQLEMTRQKLSALDMGEGGWRSLSHVRMEGMSMMIDVHDLDEVELLIDLVLSEPNSSKVVIRCGSGREKSRQPSLRPRVLKHLEAKNEGFRLRRHEKTVHVVWPKRRKDPITRLFSITPPLASIGAISAYQSMGSNLVSIFLGGAAGLMLGIMLSFHEGK